MFNSLTFLKEAFDKLKESEFYEAKPQISAELQQEECAVGKFAVTYKPGSVIVNQRQV